MKKYFKFLKSKLVLFICLIGALMTSVGLALFVANANMQFTPEIQKVAVNTATGKEYTRVEAALSDAVSGQTVYLKVGTDPILFKDAEVKQGVTFAVPYANGTIQTNGNPEAGADHMQGITTIDKCMNVLTINPNVTLTVNGTLSVGGQTSGGNGGWEESGQTAGLFAAISMRDNSKIIVGKNNGAALVCPGFIIPHTPDNGSFIDVINGYLGQPFIVGDHRGGSAYLALGLANSIKKHNWSPIKKYWMMNVQTTYRIGFNARLIAYCSLYESKGGNHYTEGSIVGNDNNALIQLQNTSGSFIAQYHPEIKGSNGRPIHNSTLSIYGAAKMNSMVLTISSVGSINTADAYFPITYMQDVQLYPVANEIAVVSLPNRLQMLPGSRLHVHEGVDLHAFKITALDYIPKGSNNPGFNDLEPEYEWGASKYTNASETHPSHNNPEFIIDGSFVSDSEMGGTILTTKNTGKLNINGSFSAVNRELLNKSSDYKEINNPIKGKTSPDSLKFGLPNREYLSNGSAWMAGEPIFEIQYKAVLPDGTQTSMPCESLPQSFKKDTVDLAIGAGDVVAGHEFSGKWYLDPGLQKALPNNMISYEGVRQYLNPEDSHLDLYGEYVISNKITIIFQDGIKNGEVVPAMNLPTSLTALPGDNIALPNASSLTYQQQDIQGNIKIDFKAIGWTISKDKELKNIINSNTGNATTFLIKEEYGKTLYLTPVIDADAKFRFTVTHNYNIPSIANDFVKLNINGTMFNYKKGNSQTFWLRETDTITINIKKKNWGDTLNTSLYTLTCNYTTYENGIVTNKFVVNNANGASSKTFNIERKVWDIDCT